MIKRRRELSKKRVLSGQRPTGPLHLGHLHGTLANWISLQEKYECFFFVADWHALTTVYEDVSSLKKDTHEMVLDWLALGLNPKKCVIYRQSDVPEVAELSLYLSMLTPLAWLERCPTYKEQLKEIQGREIATHGFVGYPVLQTADIIIPHAELVPVGEDQLPHLELAREIVRRFNYLYGRTFKEPGALLSPAAKVLGVDGRKMSKSYNNAIYLSDSPKVIKEKVRQMITDPKRIKLTDKGHPKVCHVFKLHQIYTKDNLKDIENACRKALRGCTECKNILATEISSSLTSFRSKRAELKKQPKIVEKTLQTGLKKVKPIVKATIAQVRKRMNVD